MNSIVLQDVRFSEYEVTLSCSGLDLVIMKSNNIQIIIDVDDTTSCSERGLAINCV